MQLVIDNTEIEQQEELSHDAVFHHWQITSNKSRAKMDVKRRKLITDRLKDGYSYQDMMDAISGCFLSPFHQGENKDGTKYDDFGLILRDAERMDKFITLFDETQEKFARIMAKKVAAEQTPARSDNARARLEEMRRICR